MFSNNEVQLTNYSKIVAFTLAEILIVIGILGILAELTIPSLVSSYQKKLYVVRLQKAYSQINQVLQKMAIDNGTPGDISDYFAPQTFSDPESWSYYPRYVGKIMTQYFKIAKDCGTKTGEGCFAKEGYNKYIKGYSADYDKDFLDDYNVYYKFTTIDGTSYLIRTYDSMNSFSCTYGSSDGTIPDNAPNKKKCGELTIDVNGPQKPNRYGVDTFKFYITSNKTPILYPIGGKYDGAYWNKDNCNPKYCTCPENLLNNPPGGKCAARIMDEGWQMNY